MQKAVLAVQSDGAASIDEGQCFDILARLEALEVTYEVLKATRLGRIVNMVRKSPGASAQLVARARALVHKWKEIVAPTQPGDADASLGAAANDEGGGSRDDGGGGGQGAKKKARKQKSGTPPPERPPNTVWFYSKSKKHGCQPEYAAFNNLYGGVGSSLPVPAGHAAYISTAGNTVASEPPDGWPLVIGGKRWWSTEGYYQAAKYVAAAPEYAEVIRRCPYNSIVFALGSSSRNPFAISMQKDPAVKEFYHGHFSKMDKAAALRPDWDKVKDTVMLDALRVKYRAVAGMKKLLLSTGDKIIVEHTPRDSYWGDGLGGGKSTLGTQLMQVRAELRLQAQADEQ